MADDRYNWLDEEAAERLLRGEPAGSPDGVGAAELTALLNTAAAAGRSTAPDEALPGEEAAVAAFRQASYVRDKRIPLEMCPTSNLQTGAATSYAEHPIGLLRRLQFRLTVNTDNRLMSGTSMSREFEHLVDTFRYTLDDMQWFTVNAMKSAFIPFDERLAMINDVIKPGYAELRSEWLFQQVDTVPAVISEYRSE
ncbi:Aminodeoxyfutalosine deaminase [Streptomyces rimosus subsp. rimosus]|nr:Aminodeoxyfutalosine deaminase [Streptomyces rimosus subsp. rimosus]UTJ13081.1 Aminodeoxyfutalosine deaminase [Streptomyces rimosus subsp. rimosus]